MRYGSPSIASQLDAIAKDGVQRVLVLQAYPQYSASTTASVVDAVAEWSRGARCVPEFRFVNRYHDDAGYIDALAQRIERHWSDNGRPDHLVMSFHGVPERTVTLGDPYASECRETAKRLAERLKLEEGAWTLSFQSRFGRAKWVGPATDETLRTLARRGVKAVDVACPGFTSDCLETLEEIAMEGRETFLVNGGKDFRYIPCLDDDPAWIAALGEIATRNLAGWL
jgi:ferrochelatase